MRGSKDKNVPSETSIYLVFNDDGLLPSLNPPPKHTRGLRIFYNV